MTHEILKPSFVRSDERGLFTEILNAGQWETLLAGEMNPDAVLGNHYHKLTQVFFYLVRGRVEIKTLHAESGARDQFELNDGEGVILHPFESHAIRFLMSGQYIMLKSKRYDPADPDTFALRVD